MKVNIDVLGAGWNTGLVMRAMANTLSQYNAGGDVSLMERTTRIMDSHATSIAVWAKALYLASVKDLATECCFLDVHMIGFHPRKIHEPMTDLRSLGSAAQSLYACNVRYDG